MTSLPCLQPPAAILAVGEHIEVLAWRHRLSVEILRSLGLEHFLAPIKAYKLLNTPDCDLHRGHRYAKYLLQFTLLLDSRPLAEIPIEELHILRSDARTALIYRTAVEDLPSLSNKPDVMLSRVEYYVKALMLCTGIIDPQTPSEAYNDARESDSSDSGESAYSSPDPDPTVNTGSAPEVLPFQTDIAVAAGAPCPAIREDLTSRTDSSAIAPNPVAANLSQAPNSQDMPDSLPQASLKRHDRHCILSPRMAPADKMCQRRGHATRTEQDGGVVISAQATCKQQKRGRPALWYKTGPSTWLPARRVPPAAVRRWRMEQRVQMKDLERAVLMEISGPAPAMCAGYPLLHTQPFTT